MRLGEGNEAALSGYIAGKIPERSKKVGSWSVVVNDIHFDSVDAAGEVGGTAKLRLESRDCLPKSPGTAIRLSPQGCAGSLHRSKTGCFGHGTQGDEYLILNPDLNVSRPVHLCSQLDAAHDITVRFMMGDRER